MGNLKVKKIEDAAGRSKTPQEYHARAVKGIEAVIKRMQAEVKKGKADFDKGIKKDPTSWRESYNLDQVRDGIANLAGQYGIEMY